MADYRAYFVGDDGHIIGFEPLVCGDDGEAVERAKRLVTKHSVELWSGDRLVQRLNATDRPSGDAVTHQIKDGENRYVSAAGQLNCSKSSEQFFHFFVLNQATNGGCSAIRAEVAMCDKCVELDGKIEHYQRLSSTITDQRTVDGIKELIKRMKAQKAALHPEQIE